VLRILAQRPPTVAVEVGVFALVSRKLFAGVDKVLGLPEDQRPAALVFLVACDVSAEIRRRARRWLAKVRGPQAKTLRVSENP
jgi:hypothetical protein